MAIADELYNQFNPLRPLEAAETGLYVDWQPQLGIEDVKTTLVNSLARDGDQPVWRLFTGHRGVGKTTELARVAEQLSNGVRGTRFFVSTLKGERWLDLDDIGAEDVAFQVIRQLVTDLVDRAGMSFKAEEVKGWGHRLMDWARSVDLDLGPDWLHLSLTLKDLPGKRDQFRELLRGQLPSLFDRVNDDLLGPAGEHLASRGIEGGIVAIVDDLDKIRRRVMGDQQATTNQEEVFLHHGQLLRSLRCDAIYTVPIELAYSHAQNELVNSFGSRILSLPAISLADRDGGHQPLGESALRSIYERRAAAAGTSTTAVFEDHSTLDRVLASTGGHVRSLCIAMRELIDQVDDVPIPTRVESQVLARLGRDMRRGLQSGDEAVLAEVTETGEEVDDPAFFRLLRAGYLLAYLDDASEWYRPHPWLASGPVR